MIRKTHKKKVVEVLNVHCARCGEQLEEVTAEEAEAREAETPAADIEIRYSDGVIEKIVHSDLCGKCEGVIRRAVLSMTQTKRGARMAGVE